MKVLLLGDVHGDAQWFSLACSVAKTLDCPMILQLGDFGYWEHVDRGREFLDACSESLEHHGLVCWWVDGNHENHEVLRLNYGPGGGRHNPTETGFWKIRNRLAYAPRGHRWTWGAHSFLALGGAYSIDKNHRTEGASWWPEETITDDEVTTCIEGGPVDVLVCHDAPASAVGAIPIQGTWDRQKDNWPESRANREQVQRVVDAVRPHLVVHGHYHHRNTETLRDGTRIEGFGRDGDPASMGVLDLDDLTVVDAPFLLRSAS